jgi:hypothetical protein
MKNLEIEVWGTMFQDWDNEVFRWDTDNYLKLSLDETLLYSGQLTGLTVVDADDSIDAATEAIKALKCYTFDSMKRGAFQTKEGKTEHVAYAYCNLSDTGEEVTIKYGKFHLKGDFEVADDFKLSDLTFVRLDNLAKAIQSGDPYFASLICCPGHGELYLKTVASNIKDQEEVMIR